MTSEEELAVAIGKVLAERGHLGEDEMLGDWHVMAEVSLLSPEERGKTKYVNIIPGEDGLPMHRVVGLIDICRELLDE